MDGILAFRQGFPQKGDFLLLVVYSLLQLTDSRGGNSQVLIVFPGPGRLFLQVGDSFLQGSKVFLHQVQFRQGCFAAMEANLRCLIADGGELGEHVAELLVLLVVVLLQGTERGAQFAVLRLSRSQFLSGNQRESPVSTRCGEDCRYRKK